MTQHAVPMSANRAEHLTSEARASAYAEWRGILPDGYMQAPFDAGFDAGRASVLADHDAAVAALREIAALRIRVNGAYPAALSIARRALNSELSDAP